MIPPALRQQYRDEGFFVLESAIPRDDLALLREECRRFVEQRELQMDQAASDVLGLDQRGRRYFVNDCSVKSPRLRRFVFGELMAEICRTTIGGEAYLFNDQYVVKGGEVGTEFAWHQDSGYVGYPHAPYLTCWCALDDVNESNGTVYLLPYSRAGTRDWVRHRKDERTNDMIGYFGSDEGVRVDVPAGSIACFSSTVFHRSGPNATSRLRRAYIVQYSVEPIWMPDGSRLRHQAVPFLEQGAVRSGS